MKLSWAQLSPPGPWWSSIMVVFHHCGKACVDRGDILYTHTHTHTRIADSLCCVAETNTTLHSNYTPIHIFLNTKKIKERKAPVPPAPCLSHLAPIPRAPLASWVVGAADGPLGMRWVPWVLTYGQCAWAAFMSVCPHLLDRVKLIFKKIIIHILCCSIIMSPDFFGDGPLINKCTSLVPHTWKKIFFWLKTKPIGQVFKASRGVEHDLKPRKDRSLQHLQTKVHPWTQNQDILPTKKATASQ